MHKFARLFSEIDETNRTNEKVAAMERYFASAPPRDAAWALFFLTGCKLKRILANNFLWQWIEEETGLEPWLIGECYDAVGDAGETLALLLPNNPAPSTEPLHVMVESRLLMLPTMSDDEKRRQIVGTWHELDVRQRLVWNKLITGSFRVGVQRTLVIRALSRVAGVAPDVMAHRIMGQWKPTEEDYLRLLSGEEHATDVGRPYPFYLAYHIEGNVQDLGDVAEWQIEWKWDGIRSQVIRRGNEVLVWSRGEDLVTDRFPEIQAVGQLLPPGTVIDGEIMGWKNGRPLPFGDLQKRIGRKNLSPKIMSDVPVALIAYDLMEADGVDIREQPLSERRALVEKIVAAVAPHAPVLTSPVHHPKSWDEVAVLQADAREYLAEGLMLKRLNSRYGVGRTKGDWWKWKSDPFTVDAVMIYAERGHGRRASLHTDYTFGVWKDGELLPVAKAYSGLTDAEIQEVDRWVRRNTLEKFGPVRVVKPELVFEVAFEGIQESSRHKSGIAVRFPRIARWRQDKPASEADTLENMRALLKGKR